MDFKTLSPAYLTSLGVIFCGALMVGSSSPWLIWLGWILLILALGLNVLAFVLSVGKAKGDPTPALVTNLDGFESSVEHRREEREAAEHEAAEQSAEATAEAEHEVAPVEAAEAVEATEHAETAEATEVREEEPTESQPIVDRAPGRMSVLPSRPRSGRTPKPRSNAR